jgi:hypothetical protein
MPRKPELEPRWLVGLLHQWAMRELYGSTKGLGYYSVNPMLKDGIPTQARSYEPTGYSHEDFRELEAAMKEMAQAEEYKMEVLAVLRFAKPWKAADIDQANPRETRLWLRDLKNGLATIDAKMRRLTTRNLIATMVDMC